MSVGEWTHRWAEYKNIPCHYLKSVGSSNEELKNRLEEVEMAHPLLLVTDHQTHGRGRGPHSWSDAPEGCLLSSWAWQLKLPPQHLTGPLMGLATYTACQKSWPQASWALKAPNDIFIGSNKVAGLLIENISSGPQHHLILGLGINVLAKPAVEGAGSLRDSLPEAVDEMTWHRFLDNLLAEFNSTLSSLSAHVLSPKHRDQLLKALNAFDLLESPYTEVANDGSLHTSKGVQLWTDL
jgi:BirA family biotin operon repressor/biotin-[acetyl-CoA-carboxylase] ligase